MKAHLPYAPSVSLSHSLEVLYGEPVYRTRFYQQSRAPYSWSHSVYPERSRGSLPVLELKVPMCCEKCQEKVKEELEELEGVQDVICDQLSHRVTVIGFVDPLKALKKVKKVKKKSEIFTEGTYIESIHSGRSGYDDEFEIDRDTRYINSRMVHNHRFGRDLTRSNSFGRGLGRLASFGRVTPYYNPYDDFEYRGRRGDFFGIRRMPSFNRHRHHDAEYISMDSQYAPLYGDTQYTSSYSERPIYRSQRSFSNIPVTNPYYIKHIESEYY
uniref:HMA domain-containing protein n=1 Tax=Physcomitrium patens TaxID=3218 RepID=A0A2K1IEJ7_PHYPA|nr:hypothetical protein PHYPA_029853 [Physcomitrium patens]